jgi:hypothetical protein
MKPAAWYLMSLAVIARLSEIPTRFWRILASLISTLYGCSLCSVGGIGEAHHFHSKNIDPDLSRQANDDPYTTNILWPDFRSGANGDFQEIAIVEPRHPVLRDLKAAAGRIAWGSSSHSLRRREARCNQTRRTVSRKLNQGIGRSSPRSVGSPRCDIAPPQAGAHADDAAKISGQMRLIRESAAQCNVGEPFSRGCHHELCALNSSPGHVRHGGGSQAKPEGARKVAFAQGQQIRDLADPDLRAKIFLDVGKSPLSLPSRQATRPATDSGEQLPHARMFRFRAKELRCIAEAAPCRLAVGFEE